MNLKTIPVILLCAGDSTRMWPLGDKYSLSFLGQSLVSYRILQLKKLGFSRFIAVVSKDNKNEIHRTLTPFKDVEMIEQEDKRGMAGAIISVAKHLSGETSALIVSPSDIVDDTLAAKLSDDWFTKSEGFLTGVTRESYFPGGYVTVSNGLVTDIVEKPGKDYQGTSVRFVFDYFRSLAMFVDAIERIKTPNDDVYEQALHLMIKEKRRIRYLSYAGFWGCLKYPWDGLNLMSHFLGKIIGKTIKSTDIDETVVISGDVFIDEHVKIMEFAKILGPCYLGPGTVIGNNSLVRESMVGDNCVVGFNTEIVRSLVGNNCWFHRNFVGDSVLSNNISFGAGAVTANFRLDEGIVQSRVGEERVNTARQKFGTSIGKNVRVGVNSSIMPGVKIGHDSFVGSAVLLDSDVAELKFVKVAKNHLITLKNRVETVSSNRSTIRAK